MTKQEALLVLCRYYRKFDSIPHVSHLTDSEFIRVAELCEKAVEAGEKPLAEEEILALLSRKRSYSEQVSSNAIQELRRDICEEARGGWIRQVWRFFWNWRKSS